MSESDPEESLPVADGDPEAEDADADGSVSSSEPVEGGDEKSSEAPVDENELVELHRLYRGSVA